MGMAYLQNTEFNCYTILIIILYGACIKDECGHVYM